MQVETGGVISGVLNLLAVVLLLTALIIAARNSVRMIINTYRIQSLLIAALTGLTAWKKLSRGGGISGTDVVLMLFIVALPLMLAVFIKPLLARATVQRQQGRSLVTEIRLMFVWCLRPLFAGAGRGRRGARVGPAAGGVDPAGSAPGAARSPSKNELLDLSHRMARDAERAWLLYRPSTRMESRYLLMFFVLVGSAFLIVFITTDEVRPGGVPFPQSDQIGLVVSISLNLIGLYNMSIRQDLISQVIGLLIMDHGLFLAVVKIVKMPAPAWYFVVSLYLYTVITIFILVVLLPRLRTLTRSINLGDIARESRLKG